jgi:hypothetical protein
MSGEWQYQVRIDLSEELAEVARRDPGDPALAPLGEVLRRHGAALVCQYDAFAGYVAEAEAHGVDGYPLYAWTKATIEDPAKKAKYLKSFTLYLDGAQVYPKDRAEALEADLRPLLASGLIAKLARYDTNPATNPQPPERYRR